MTRKVALVGENVGKSNTVDSHHHRSNEDMLVSARPAMKVKYVWVAATKAIEFNATIDACKVFRVVDAVSKGSSTAEDTREVFRNNEKPIFLRICLSYATGIIKVVSHEM